MGPRNVGCTSLGRKMLKLTGEQVTCIHNDWRGNKGELSLWGLKKKYGLDVNVLYSVLSATHAKQAFGQKRRVGMKVHSYDPDYKKTAL